MLALTLRPVMFFFSFLLATLLFSGTQSAFADATTAEWELIADRDGIIVHKKLDKDTGIAAFRGNTVIEESDPYAFVALMNDFNNYPRWLHFVSHAKELEQVTPLERYLRFQTLLPWPLKNREALLKAEVTQYLPEGEEGYDFVEISLSNAPDYLPPNSDYIRFPYIEGVFSFKWLSANEVSVTYELQLDPGGYIRPWLANILLRDAPYFTLERLRRLIKSPAYHGHTFDYIQFDHFTKDAEDALSN